jgi:hypothetical protein
VLAGKPLFPSKVILLLPLQVASSLECPGKPCLTALEPWSLGRLNMQYLWPQCLSGGGRGALKTTRRLALLS